MKTKTKVFLFDSVVIFLQLMFLAYVAYQAGLLF